MYLYSENKNKRRCINIKINKITNILKQHKLITSISVISIIALFLIGGIALANSNTNPIENNKTIGLGVVAENSKEDGNIKENKKKDIKTTTEEVINTEVAKATSQDSPNGEVSFSNNSNQQMTNTPKKTSGAEDQGAISSQSTNAETLTYPETPAESVTPATPKPVTPEPVTPTVVTPSIKKELPNNYDIQYLSDYETEIMVLVNQLRVDNGVQKLVLNNPVSCCGENIHSYEVTDSSMSFTALQIFTAWANSPGHRANMLDPDYKKIGVGVAQC